MNPMVSAAVCPTVLHAHVNVSIYLYYTFFFLKHYHEIFAWEEKKIFFFVVENEWLDQPDNWTIANEKKMRKKQYKQYLYLT